MKSYKQFAKDHRVTLTASHRGQRTEKMGDHKVNQDIWSCTLLYNGMGYDFPFYKGIGNKGAAPTVDEVLYCLASDAHGVKDNSFEEWCREYGYDDDSRKALRIFEACEETAQELERLFGTDLLNELYYETNEEGDE